MIITSLLDNDQYKFTMMQAVYHQFSGVNVEYKFTCRNNNPQIEFSQRLVDEIRFEIDTVLCELKFSRDELEYLSKLRFIKSDFIEFLKLFKLDKKFVSVKLDAQSNSIDLRIKGPWLHTILFEVPLLAIINEAYSRSQCKDLNTATNNLREKILFIDKHEMKENFKFADFGTRRRFSRAWQGSVIEALKANFSNNFVGTSNLYFAKQCHLRPIGTMAHEWLQAHQALYKIEDSQKIALQNWANEYRGDLGIALTDVVGVHAFLNDFDLYFSKLFDGVRHDSGDPIAFGKLIVNHYKKMGIDPRTKTIVFSDGLNVESAFEIYKTFYRDINISFGIGTNLTNDMGFKPIQIVIKMVKCNGRDVAKVSDAPSKGMCENDEYVEYLKHVYHYIPLEPSL